MRLKVYVLIRMLWEMRIEREVDMQSALNRLSVRNNMENYWEKFCVKTELAMLLAVMYGELHYHQCQGSHSENVLSHRDLILNIWSPPHTPCLFCGSVTVYLSNLYRFFQYKLARRYFRCGWQKEKRANLRRLFTLKRQTKIFNSE